MMRALVCGAVVGLVLTAAGAVRAEDPAPGSYPVSFKAGKPAATIEPRFAAPAAEAALAPAPTLPTQGRDPLAGRIAVGPAPAKERPVALVRSRSGQPYDLLLIDRDGDGSLVHERAVTATLRKSTDATWSTFEVAIRVNHGSEALPVWEWYPLGLWVVVHADDEKPEKFFFVAHGYKAGRIKLDEKDYDVVLSDADNDAVYGVGDTWTIRPADAELPYESVEAREVGDFAWAGERAWKLELEGTTGRAGRIVPFDPGITQEQDEKKRDPCWADRRAPRAEAPLSFERDPKAGYAKARKDQAPVLLTFGTSQSLPCMDMERLVYSQAAVVSAATGLVGIRIDADEQPDLKTKHKVEEIPTGILFDPKGNELARFTGYQTGEQLQAFLAEAHPYLRPADHEPKLGGKAKKRHKAEVKRFYDYMQDGKGHGLLVDRIRDLGTRKTRAARDALMQFAIKRKSKEYIKAAFDALAQIKGKIAVEFLCGPDALGSGDFLVAESAAIALEEAKDPAAVDPILAIMTNRRTKIEIVRACALAVARSAPTDEYVLGKIHEFSHHKKDTIRAGAAEALGYLRADKAVERLIDILKHDKNTRVRQAAAWGIGHTGRTDLIPLLREAIASDKSHTVRTAGLEAIRELQGEER